MSTQKIYGIPMDAELYYTLVELLEAEKFSEADELLKSLGETFGVTMDSETVYKFLEELENDVMRV